MNPVATTLAYEQMTEAIFSELVSLAPTHRRKKSASESTKGFLGTPFAWSYVHELNGRKSFHLHGAVHGGPSPTLFLDFHHCPVISQNFP